VAGTGGKKGESGKKRKKLLKKRSWVFGWRTWERPKVEEERAEKNSKLVREPGGGRPLKLTQELSKKKNLRHIKGKKKKTEEKDSKQKRNRGKGGRKNAKVGQKGEDVKKKKKVRGRGDPLQPFEKGGTT